MKLPKLRPNEWVATGILCVGVAWLGLKVSGQVLRLAEDVGKILPEWFPLFNLFLLPAVTAVLFLRPTRHIWSLLLLFVVGLFSLSMLYLSGQKYLWATVVVNVVVLAEMYWIMPRVRRWREKRQVASK